MFMILKFILAACAAGAIVALVYLAKAALLTPVHIGKNERLEICIRVTGAAPELEHTVKGILWLVESGAISADITMADEGMDEETRRAAEILNIRGLARLKD